jgi:hypothetical protein
MSLEFFLIGILADYVALGKTRLLLRLFRKHYSSLTVVVGDIIASIMISIFFSSVYVWVSLWIFKYIYHFDINILERYIIVIPMGLKYDLTWIFKPSEGQYYGEYDVFILSTLITSIWTVLILLSTAAVKLLAPVQRGTAWFFDVEKHPVRAIGITAGALLMIGSLLWSLVRTVI